MKVMLVDPLPSAFARVLEARGHSVVAEVSNGREAVSKVGQASRDIVLLDVTLPDMSGFEATRLIKIRHPMVRIVIVAVEADEQGLFEAIKSGADGLLMKDMEEDELLEALNGIRRGEAVIPRHLTGGLIEEFRLLATGGKRTRNDGACLSHREQEVTELVAQGLSYREVADRLYVTENTIKYHMGNVMNKLQLRNRARVMAWFAGRNAASKRMGAEHRANPFV